MRALFLSAATVFICTATNVPGLSVEELFQKSDRIITGRVLKSTTSWGIEHKYIWTRYEVAVEEALKGTAGKILIVSEPGGHLDGKLMQVAGAVVYTPGEHVALFLKTYGADNRTVGWAQGKFSIDRNDRVHPCARAGSATVGGGSTATPLSRLDGIRVSELRKRVREAGVRRRVQ